ncbi:MAG: hypothetical protein A3K07_00625 [Candidatus Doudnabacteria bacterium RIFCSPHIGHO2_01_43_10]|nr:MAG: hypothetical protein A3K07_00625 [Candidatus Doudnabacteria bacterium RIFCSPHIGHO2_01_43_10]
MDLGLVWLRITNTRLDLYPEYRSDRIFCEHKNLYCKLPLKWIFIRVAISEEIRKASKKSVLAPSLIRGTAGGAEEPLDMILIG